MFVIKQVDGDGICSECKYFNAVSNYENNSSNPIHNRNKIYCKYFDMCNYAVLKYKLKQTQSIKEQSKED